MLIGTVYFFTGLAIVSLATTWLFQWVVLRVVNRPLGNVAWTPPVSILKPLAGVDEGLLENLRSIARLDYPTFEIIFGIEDPADPARPVVEQICQEFPHVAISLVVNSPQLGRNPKVNNLAGMTKHARYEYLLVSDANVRVKPDYLRAIASEFADEKVGLVCNIIAGNHSLSLGALFEDLHLTTFIAAAVSGATVLGGHPCVVGKSMLLRRTDLHRLKGWYGVRNVLAEDYVLGQRFYAAGLRVVLSPHIVHAVHLRRSVKDFFARHVRWAQMRRRLAPATYVGELLLNPTPWCIALLLSATQTLNRSAMALAAVLLVAKCLADALLMWRLNQRSILFWQFLTIPFKDCLVFCIWMVGAFRRRVIWRGHIMRIGEDSRLLALDEDETQMLVESEI